MAALGALVLVVAFGVAFGVAPAGAQEAPPTPWPEAVTAASVERLARVDRGAALGVDPRGRLFVVDAGRGAVLVRDRDGTPLFTLGGPGTRAGEFDAPADVDPTNGLTIFVADAGNGRIQRFSDDGQFLEALPVGRVDPASDRFGRQPVYDAGRDGADARAEGEPVAVVSTSANEVYAVDARRGSVVRFDAQRRPEPVAGRDGAPRGGLAEPVALALDARGRLYVADRARAHIRVYDVFGEPVATLHPVPTPDVRALVVRGDALWIVEPDRVVVSTREGTLVRTVPVTLDAPLVDVAASRGAEGDSVYLLTETALYVLTTP